jgi:hypothetical protein
MPKRSITGRNQAHVEVTHLNVGQPDESTIVSLSEVLDGEEHQTSITLSPKGRKALWQALHKQKEKK